MKSFFNILDKFINNKYFILIFTTLLVLSSIISFQLKINLSNIFGTFFYNEYLLNYNIQTKGGGVVNDLKTHWNYILLLKEDLSNLLSLTMGKDTNLINFPLHHIIFSQLSFIDSINKYLISNFIICLFFPIIFYFSLSKRFENSYKLNLILISSLIYIFPAFQYSAIWGNNHITALIFFSIGIYFYNVYNGDGPKKIKYLLISIIFLSLTCYIKQFYSFFFIYLIFDLYKNINFKKFFWILIFIFTCALPGIFFLKQNPLLFLGIKQNITNFNSAILISGSIVFFYLIPFIIQNILNFPGNLKDKLLNIYDKKFIFISVLIVFLCSLNFEYNSTVGGGIFLKLSYYIFNNQFLVFPTALLGIYFLLFYCEHKQSGFLLVILILITFSTGFFIFQKYFELMFFLIFLNLFDKKKIIISIKENNYVMIIYFCGYYLLSNYIYFRGL